MPYSLSEHTWVTIYVIPDCPYCRAAKSTINWLANQLRFNFHYDIRQASELPLIYEVGCIPALKEYGLDLIASETMRSFDNRPPLTILGDIGGEFEVVRACDTLGSMLRDLPENVVKDAH